MPVPKHLSKPAKTWWRKIHKEYSITDQAGLLLLQTAPEAYDRLKEAQETIGKDGLMVKDRFGQDKSHPLLTVERDSRSQMLLALKALQLDIDPSQEGAS